MIIEETYLEVCNTVFKGLELRSAVATINGDISTQSNCCAQNWNLTELFLRHELVVSPANGRAQEWDIHPRTMVGNKQSRLVLLVKLFELFQTNHFWV